MAVGRFATTIGLFALGMLPIAYYRMLHAATNLDPRATFASEALFQLAPLAALGVVGGALGGPIGAGIILGLCYGIPLYNDLLATGIDAESAQNGAMFQGAVYAVFGGAVWFFSTALARRIVGESKAR